MAEADFSADDQKVLDAMRAEQVADEPATAPAPEAPPPASDSSLEPVAEAVDGTGAASKQPRDEKGKFANATKDKTEAQPAAAQAHPEDRSETKHVPLAALHEEREKRQALRTEFDQYRGTIEERLKQLQDRIKPAEQPKPIDVEAQPIEALKDTRQRLDQVQQAQQQAFQRQQFATHVATQVQEYKAKTEDYDSAYRYLRDGRVAELSAMGYHPTQIAQQLEQDEFGISAMALQRGENPGAALYKIAQARGYKKAEPAPQPQQQPAQQQAPSALERLAAAEKGQQAAKSLGAPGAAPAATLTLENLATMSPDQLAKLSDEDFRRVMGG